MSSYIRFHSCFIFGLVKLRFLIASGTLFYFIIKRVFVDRHTTFGININSVLERWLKE
jgi:hypothetical protein